MALTNQTRTYITTALANNAVGKEVGDLINTLSGQPATVSISAAAGGTNVSEVTFTVKDVNGTAMTVPTLLTVYLSDSSAGTGLTATSASGTVQAKASSGVDFSTLTSKKALRV